MKTAEQGLAAASTNGDKSAYSKPLEAQKVFQKSLLENSIVAEDLPHEIGEAASHVAFTGSDEPSLPINWRFAEAVSALKALEAALVNVLLKRKYGVDMSDVTIDTDKAQLFLFSSALWTIDPDGANISPDRLQGLDKYFPNRDIHHIASSFYRTLATNIYKCSDGKWFNLHASLDPNPTLDSLGLPHDLDLRSNEEAISKYVGAVAQVESPEMQRLVSEVYRQAGTICNSVEDFTTSEHGRENAHVGLWEIYDKPNPAQPPSWWPESSQTSSSCPLAGLKIVDLTRIIAAPAVTRSLAELGASVMRCTSSHLPDASVLHCDLNWGKWNCNLDLRESEDRQKLEKLIADADVVVQGYRPGALDKYGFSQEGIIELCKHRERGIISVRENCYGWHGPFQDRSGWQQISDANVGLAMEFGKAMGNGGEPVTPVFPHSDYSTGIAGSCAIIIALLRRAQTGGSYCVDLALNHYNAWLASHVGEYPRPVFEKVWHDECGGPVFRHFHNINHTRPTVMTQLRNGIGGKRLFKDEYFEERPAPVAMGDSQKKIKCLKPIADWKGVVDLRFNVGTRGNGTDAARWPDDLMVETVA